MKRVLLTGGSGFIGANLARRLITEGHDVHLLIRPGHEDWRIREVEAHATFHAVDLLDHERLRHVVERIRPEWIFHLAVYGAYSWQNDSDLMQRTNVAGTMGLVDVCAGIGFESFVNTGSSSEYGFLDRTATEEDPPEPNSAYAYTKASATLYCRYTARKNGLRIPTLRLYSAYGPFEDPRRLLPTVIVAGLDGRLPNLVNPDIARDFVYVDDVAEAFILAAHHQMSDPGAVYNVASSQQTSIRDLVALAREELSIDEEPRWGSMQSRSWDTSVWSGSSEKINRELGWSATADLRRGFESFVEWLRENPEMLAHYRAISGSRG